MDLDSSWASRAVSAADAVAHVRSGDRVFVHGAAATPIPLIDALSARRDLDGVRLYHLHTQGSTACFAPEVTDWLRSVSMFVGPDARAAVADGERALAIGLSAWGPEFPDIAATRRQLGLIYIEQLGEIARGERELTAARALYTAQLGPDTIDVANCEQGLSVAGQYRGDYAAALAHAERAERIYAQRLGADHQRRGESLMGIGVLRFLRKDFGGSLTAYQAALPILAAALGDRHLTVGYLHSNLGETLLALGRPDDAEPVPVRSSPSPRPPLSDRDRFRRSGLERGARGTTRARTRPTPRVRPNRPDRGSSITSNSASCSSTPKRSSAASLASSTVFPVVSTHSTVALTPCCRSRRCCRCRWCCHCRWRCWRSRRRQRLPPGPDGPKIHGWVSVAPIDAG